VGFSFGLSHGLPRPLSGEAKSLAFDGGDDLPAKQVSQFVRGVLGGDGDEVRGPGGQGGIVFLSKCDRARLSGWRIGFASRLEVAR